MGSRLEQVAGEIPDKATRKAMPGWTSPMLATLTHDHFSRQGWLFERKLDGQRCLIFRKGDKVRIMSRNRKSQNRFFPEIVDALEDLDADCILDGELVTFDGDLTSFSSLQNRIHNANPGSDLLKQYPVVLYLFDILYLDGYDLCALALRERKKLLKGTVSFGDRVRYLQHINRDGEDYLQQACKKGWEGVIAKDAASRYSHSRSRNWLKFKCAHGQELVIAGYTEPQGERVGFGALLVGYYGNNGGADRLCYAGKVGTGFDDAFLESFHRKMARHERKTCPFADYDGDTRGVHWITPRFVGEFAFTEWTHAGRLRHPRFLGLRKDKPPGEVVREAG